MLKQFIIRFDVGTTDWSNIGLSADFEFKFYDPFWEYNDGPFDPGGGAQWQSTNIPGAHLAVGSSVTSRINDYTDPTSVTPPPEVTLAYIQDLIANGATFTSADYSPSFQGLNLGNCTITGTTLPISADIDQLMNTSFLITQDTPANVRLNIADIFFELDIPDAPTLSVTGSGGIEIGDIATEDFIEMSPQLIVVGSGGIELGGSADEVLSKDISGIYTLVKDKTNDTLYNRTAGGSVTSLVVKIPNPFIKSGYMGS